MFLCPKYLPRSLCLPQNNYNFTIYRYIHGTAENLGWVKDEKNAEIRAKFKRIFDWFDEVGDEDNPNSIVLRITLTEGTITDNEKKYGERQYEVDFIHKMAK